MTFWDLVPLKECNADGICEAIKNRKHGLELQKLVAIGTDNASVMMVINNGIYAKFKKEIPGFGALCLSFTKIGWFHMQQAKVFQNRISS